VGGLEVCYYVGVWKWGYPSLTYQEKDAINQDEWSSDVVLVSQISPCVHDNSGSHIGWGDEALRGRDAETHSIVENDGEKVSNSVGTGRCEHEQTGKPPHFQVQGILEVAPNTKGFRDSVVTVLLNSCDDEGGFLFVDELQLEASVCGLLGKVNNEEIGAECEHTGY
jgi:hypothetical protein